MLLLLIFAETFFIHFVKLLLCYCKFLSTPGKVKNIPDRGGNAIHDLWNASPTAMSTTIITRKSTLISSALSFKEISMKNSHHSKGGVSVTGMCHTIFSNLLCPALCLNPFYHEKSHIKVYSKSIFDILYLRVFSI